MSHETTLVLIKPGGIHRNLIGEICRRIELRDLKIVALKFIKADRKVVEKHYEEHQEKSFFAETCDYLTKDPIIAMAVRGPNSIRAIRAMMGATHPVEAIPGTIRGDFALTIEENLTHSSADQGAAERELSLWFPEGFVRG